MIGDKYIPISCRGCLRSPYMWGRGEPRFVLDTDRGIVFACPSRKRGFTGKTFLQYVPYAGKELCTRCCVIGYIHKVSNDGITLAQLEGDDLVILDPHIATLMNPADESVMHIDYFMNEIQRINELTDLPLSS